MALRELHANEQRRARAFAERAFTAWLRLLLGKQRALLREETEERRRVRLAT